MSESSGEGDNSYPQGNVPQDKNWEWIACVYDMKRSTPESEITWNLSPSIMLTLPSEQNVQPKVDLIIESSKQFIYSEGLGWNWHKSWNIPDIHCTLDAEIYVVRAVINQIHTFHLVDVGIKGGNRSEFDSSRCVFTGLKFDTTSYNHEGSKFHLVIVVYLNQNKFEHPKILESRISPPIFVDSRKSARDTQHQKAQKLSSFIDPFLPENMDKKFIKRESKRKYNADEPIDNNIEGLSNYFSAPNIRHKVKHPLFLAIKFSSCVKIYFNVNIIPCNNNNEKFVEVMQKQLMEAYNRSSTNTNMNIEDKPLILTIEHTLSQQSFKQKKINEFLEPLHGDVLHVMIDPVNIPKNFRKLEDIDGVKEAYRKVYPKISQQKFGQGGDDEDSGPPVKKGSKVKVEKDNKKNYQSDSDDDFQGANPSKKIKGNEVQSVIESQKLQIKNPAQQSEIFLNQNAQNQQQMKSMIMEGAKPQKEKLPKGAEKAQAAKPEETGKAKGGRGKKGAKNAAAANEPPQAPSLQNIPSQTQLPTTQFSQQNSNGSTILPVQNMGASGSQQTSNNNSVQWSQQQSSNPGMQKPPHLNNSQQMQYGGDVSQQNLNKGAPPTGFPQQNQPGLQQQNPYAAQQQPIGGSSQIDGNNNVGPDGQKRFNQGQQQYGQPGYGIPGGQQQLNNMPPGQQRPPNLGGSQQGQPGYHQQPQMGANHQVPGQQQGQLPGLNQQTSQNQSYLNGGGHNMPGQVQQPGMGLNHQGLQNKSLSTPNNVANKEGYEDPNLQGRNPANIQGGQFKPPTSGGTNPHLHQSQHQYGGHAPGVQAPGVQAPLGNDHDAQADTTDPIKLQYSQSQTQQQQYNMGQNQLQQTQGQTGQFGNQYNPQQQYQQYQRNNSQQFPQQQQQNRMMPIQMNQQGQIVGANQQGGQFSDQQSGNQFMQNGNDMHQYGNNNNNYNQNPQGQFQQYQIPNVAGQNPNTYDEDDQFNQQNQYNRNTSNSQGQFQFQGQPGQNMQYNYQNQYQNNQNMNNQQYGYNQQQQYNNFQQQNMNPQFQQYYQQQQQTQQPNQQDMYNQGMNQYGQMRTQSNSIPHQYYQPKEEEYQKNMFQ